MGNLENGISDIPLNEKMLLTVGEVKALTGIGRNNCFKIIQKSGCSFRVGKKILVDREAFQTWLRKQYS